MNEIMVFFFSVSLYICSPFSHTNTALLDLFFYFILVHFLFLTLYFCGNKYHIPHRYHIMCVTIPCKPIH